MLEDLSSELIIQILHCCEYPTILRFGATCKEYGELVTQSTSLQLHIELEANGLELVKGSFARGVTYSMILDDLKGFHNSWMDLRIREPILRPVGNARMLLWELREGFYVKAFSQSDGRLADALHFIPLDHVTPDRPPLLFDFKFNEFTVDPGQGLVAIMSSNLGLFTTIHVDLRSAATGLAHSLARCPRLTAEFDFERPFFSPKLAIEIIKDMVVTKISHTRLHTYELLVWNWKSGILLNRIASRQGICDFTLLDQHHLVILSGTRSDPNQEGLRNLELLVYNLSHGGSSYNSICQGHLVTDLEVSQPILRLAFPQIQKSSRISESDFYLVSEPIPGRSRYKNSADFACSYATTLSMAFGFSRVDTGWEGDYYRVFLDGRFLLNQVRIRSNKTMLLPWPSWGTSATRWFVAPRQPDRWVSWMSGSRFVNRLSGQPYYCILDFSPPNTRWPRCRNSQPCPATADDPSDARDLLLGNGSVDLRLLDQILHRRTAESCKLFIATIGADCPSIISGPGFEEQITSQLPYRIVCRTSNKLYHEGWQVNGDCIVGVNSRGIASESLGIYKLEKMIVPKSNVW
ncbi:unnamed protein product [Rhizoctonia solani]|uniref:F-box domain-containing protein n=1 Tax=Rhizoctonia solani TaxID=456999 RepID=A0A8H3AWA8_9AGAM|nr:unnamed protein product [Rhizoctonia solani]